MNEKIVLGKDRCSYASPQITVLALLAEQAVLSISGTGRVGLPGENDPIINDYGTL